MSDVIHWLQEHFTWGNPYTDWNNSDIFNENLKKQPRGRVSLSFRCRFERKLYDIRHSHLQMNEQKMFSFPMMLVSLLPHSAEAVSGQLPVVPKVNIVKVHQSRGEDTQHPGPVPCAVVLVWSSHNVPHDNGLYPLLLKNRVTVRVTHLWWQIVLILTSHRRTRVLKF